MDPNDKKIAESPEDHPPKKKRTLLIVLLTIFILAIGLIWGTYWLMIGQFYQETNNAYVNGNIIPITSQVAGTITSIDVDDTEFVNTDQILVELDPLDSFVVFQQANANLAKTIRSTQQLFINNNGLEASIHDKQANQEKARLDLGRRNQAIQIGAVSKEELTNAEDTLKSADALLTAARSAFLANRALTEHTTLRYHPNVLAAAAVFEKAYIDYKRSIIRAPVAGEISKRTAQIGQRIFIGTPLMVLVPLDQVWVDANFKEKQVRNMRLGQKATVSSDLYGSSVTYRGKVVGFSAGTGSAFALLPAQNATGNWIKVVQRLPVRIVLNPQDLAAHPLKIGLSMIVTVDTHNRTGNRMNTAYRMPKYTTKIYDDLSKQAEIEVANTIVDDIKHTANLNLNLNAMRGAD